MTASARGPDEAGVLPPGPWLGRYPCGSTTGRPGRMRGGAAAPPRRAELIWGRGGRTNPSWRAGRAVGDQGGAVRTTAASAGAAADKTGRGEPGRWSNTGPRRGQGADPAVGALPNPR